MNEQYDVAIVGGGPAGSTAACLLKKYNPDIQVAIFERETFPRDHIGESLLPPTCRILDEMGCWDKIEAANFPIKLGATYRWGKRPELWHFDFYPEEDFVEQERPGTYEGQRALTAFQVDRSLYDKILLDHAKQLGCEVFEGAKVVAVEAELDRVNSLTVRGMPAEGSPCEDREFVRDTQVTARYYVDASGNSGILRRALDIPCDYPSTLKNIAIYDYWQNAEWAVKIGVGGTRIQVLSVGYGWLWFIPLGPTRTSIGLVVPAEHFKECGLSSAELYKEALQKESIVAGLIANAHSEGKLQTTRDWSFLAEQQAGENWFLVGESAGFADPILSAGVTIAHLGAQELAYTILEIERGKQNRKWLRNEFSTRQEQRIRTHIRFGDYWYTANEQLKELKEFTTTLAANIGLELTPEAAWEWIARGGFIDDTLCIGAGGYSLSSIKGMSGKLMDLDARSPLERFNVFKLDLSGASWKDRASYRAGRVVTTPSYVRGSRVLPIENHIEAAVTVLEQCSDITDIVEGFRGAIATQFSDPRKVEELFQNGICAIEAMISDGWIQCSYNPDRPMWAPSEWCDRPIKWARNGSP